VFHLSLRPRTDYRPNPSRINDIIDVSDTPPGRSAEPPTSLTYTSQLVANGHWGRNAIAPFKNGSNAVCFRPVRIFCRPNSFIMNELVCPMRQCGRNDQFSLFDG